MWKEDEGNDGRMLEGAQYEVRDGSGLLYCTMVTDKDGYALSIDLPVGTYYVREVVPPAGFILSDEVIEVKITIIRGNPTALTMKELKKEYGSQIEPREALTVAQQRAFFEYLLHHPLYKHWYPVFFIGVYRM